MTKKQELGPRQREWVEALRSGKWRQAKGVLKNGDSFCCLGVACEISGLGEWKVPEEEDREKYLGAATVLPEEVMDFFSFKDEFGSHENLDSSLTRDNDSGKSFSEIADIIEENAEELFNEPK